MSMSFHSAFSPVSFAGQPKAKPPEAKKPDTPKADGNTGGSLRPAPTYPTGQAVSG